MNRDALFDPEDPPADVGEQERPEQLRSLGYVDQRQRAKAGAWLWTRT